MHGEIALNPSMVIEEDDAEDEGNGKADSVTSKTAFLQDMMLPTEKSHVIERKGFEDTDSDIVSGKTIIFTDDI